MSTVMRAVATYQRSIMRVIFAALLSVVIAKIRGTSKHQPDLSKVAPPA